MGRIAILTFHTALNYGALLQAYALQQTLNDQNATVEILDYRNEIIDKAYYYPTLFERKSVREIIKYVVQGKAELKRRDKFDEFRRKKLVLSSERYTCANVQMANDRYDLFVAGSDQVWNYMAHGFDKNYFLEFVTDPRKKRSYAASIGLSELSDEVGVEYKRLLKDYPVCSVREKQGIDALEEIGITQARLDIDPSFLLDKEQWCEKLEIKEEKKNYIFAYYFQLTDSLKAFVEKLAVETGCYVVYLGSAWKAPFSCKCKPVKTAGPIDFVTIICNAKYVVTNSFHGTAFSINFNKTFFVELLKKDSQVNSRLINILKATNLMGREISTIGSMKNAVNSEIAWDEVNSRIHVLRETSMSYIQEWLK